MYKASLTRLALKITLFITPLTALVFSRAVILPYSLPKIIFFRSAVEIVAALFFFYISFISKSERRVLWDRAATLLKNPVAIFLFLFLLSYIVSSFFADNAYRAFWGTLERGEGVFGTLHFYVYFLLLYLTFGKKDWAYYFSAFLVTGFMLALYSAFQYFGSTNIAGERVSAIVGNPAFLATHMLFVMIFGGLFMASRLLQHNESAGVVQFYIPAGKKNGFYLTLFLVILSLLTIFLTGTRGAILGATVGFLVFMAILAFYKKDVYFSSYPLKKMARYLIVAFVIFTAVFFLTKNAPVWQAIPGLNRIANTNLFSFKDSAPFRLLTWQVSWEAFKERPILGWGPENYLNAYEKYYDPDFSLYGDTWLDRAHNKIFDLLVMQGVIGLIVYLGFFVVLTRAILKRIYKENFLLALTLIAGISAYFIQNLFLFDQILSDMAFFSLLAFVIAYVNGDRQTQTIANEPPSLNERFVLLSVASGVGLLGLMSLYYLHVIPYAQAKLFRIAPRGSSIERSYELVQKALSPYNYAQATIRGFGIDDIYMDDYFNNPNVLSAPEFSKLTDLLVQSIQEIVEREPYDVRFHIREAQMLSAIARSYDDENDPRVIELNLQIEKLMRDALEFAPKRQDVYYHLALSLAGQNKYKEAMETSEKAIALNPKVPRSYMNAAVVYAIAGENEKSKAALKKIDEFATPYQNFFGSDFNNMIYLYTVFGNEKKVVELVLKSLKGDIGQTFDLSYYGRALTYFRDAKDKENFLLVANYLAKFPDLREDMKVLIDLAEKGEWDILHKF
ncbi:MAG: O-antigen ligase family protein [Candidatus Liptonbacteria bacterium]|nr:O-antigen ligase family protein [Candidatus Liptonbacteria bacterium]